MARANHEDAARDKLNETTPQAEQAKTGTDSQQQAGDDTYDSMQQGGSETPPRINDWASI